MLSLLNTFLENNVYNRVLNRNKVDFSKKWTSIFDPYKFLFFIGFIASLFERLLEALLPFIVSAIFTGSIPFWIIFLAIFISLIVSPFGFNLLFRLEMQIFGDIDRSLTDTVLEVDPINHTTKSSSLLIGKMKKGLNQLSNLIFAIAIDIPVRLIFLLVSIVSLFIIDIKLGLIILIFIISVVYLNFRLRNTFIEKYKNISIKSEDLFVELVNENISQAQLIRASFATQERKELFNNRYKNYLFDAVNQNFSFSISFTISKFLLLLSVPFVSFYLFELVKNGRLETAFAIASLTSFIFGITQIIGFGGQLLKLFIAQKDVESLFNYVNKIGHKTYPVLRQNNNKNIKN